MLKKIKTKKRRLVVREICVEFVAKNVGTGFQKASRWVSVNMQKILSSRQHISYTLPIFLQDLLLHYQHAKRLEFASGNHANLILPLQ